MSCLASEAQSWSSRAYAVSVLAGQGPPIRGQQSLASLDTVVQLTVNSVYCQSMSDQLLLLSVTGATD
ncbi:MAG: hypothetical protein J07HX5_02095 [halophilic archaeon J07HX5]|nr:MAG: hypothetical protein J07HX5_02095 [halophilic archaeon J07HX5]